MAAVMFVTAQAHSHRSVPTSRRARRELEPVPRGGPRRRESARFSPFQTTSADYRSDAVLPANRTALGGTRVAHRREAVVARRQSSGTIIAAGGATRRRTKGLPPPTMEALSPPECHQLAERVHQGAVGRPCCVHRPRSTDWSGCSTRLRTSKIMFARVGLNLAQPGSPVSANLRQTPFICSESRRGGD